MDISSPRKNNLSSQNSIGARGVVDLRRFSQTQKQSQPAQNRKVFYEIRPGKNLAEKKFENQKPVEADFINKHKEESFEDKKETSVVNRTSSEDTSDNFRGKKSIALNLPKISRPVKKTKEINCIPTFPGFSQPYLSQPKSHKPNLHLKKSFVRFAIASFMVPVVIFSFSFAQTQFEQKGKVLSESTVAYDNMKSAAQYAFASDFTATQENFENANTNFAQAHEAIDELGLGIGEVIGKLPVSTPISTAQNLTVAGQNLSLAGKNLGNMLAKVSDCLAQNENDPSLGNLAALQTDLETISGYLDGANLAMQKVDTNYIPADMRDKIILAQKTLPVISKNFDNFSADYPLILKMIGADTQQKYLLLFENNSEMRATGGFIGSYGILDIENGHIQDINIDGIFDPDGQLREKVVPPMPIQKISAAWSMHDSNWFADFPTSAKKAALFYEKTGGQTVDGVIAITPETIKKLLEVTGPIDMPEYNVTLTADNFVSETQDQVENQYDKQENKPKKILSDMAPILIEKLFKDSTLDRNAKTERLIGFMQKIEESLREKQILIYHRDDSVESMIQKRGWGGEIIQNQTGDYLSVVNSNINGYKTDAVIDESINLNTQIEEDGSVIDTVTITRKHLGGDQSYDWYNRVNADYMRVYVPKGSVLLSATGNTTEQYNPPIDYSNFKTDPDVQAVEQTIKIDPQSQTQIFEESGKTVFGNWIYVSPKEQVTVTYKYELPFKINFNSFSKSVDAYSAIIQKQAGSTGSNFTATIKLPQEWQIAWKTDAVNNSDNVSQKLTRDLIYGIIVSKK